MRLSRSAASTRLGAAGLSRPSASSRFAAALPPLAAAAAASPLVFFGFGKLAGAPGSGTAFGCASFSSAAFCAATCVPFVPYFLISTATFSDGCAPTPIQ